MNILKTVFFLNRFLIGLFDQLFAGESADQHKKRGARQVKIGNQAIGHFKLKSWINKDVGMPANPAVIARSLATEGGGRRSNLFRAMFQNACRRGAHREDLPARLLRL